jgi:class 3 adenylate cyclase
VSERRGGGLEERVFDRSIPPLTPSMGDGPMATLVDERTLDERLARLEAARPWSPRVVSRLEALLRTKDDAALFRVNPFTFASQQGLDRGEAIDLFLHATALGLFEMDWLLVCPRCACAVESFARLRAVLRRFRCPECHNEYEAAMDDFIAIYFSVSPQICAIRYHRPETLEPFDYMFAFRGVREGRRPDGVPYVDSVRSALRGIGFLEPQSTATFEFEAAEGALSGISTDTEAGFVLQVGGAPVAEPQRLRLTYLGTGYRPNEAVLAPGPVTLEVENPTSSRGVLAIVQAAPGDEDALLNFDPYLTGKHLLTSQTFRSLFRSEVVGGAQGLAIRDIALLFTDIRGSTALYQRIGDLNAFQLVQQHFDLLRETTVRHGGAIVKTIGDAVMAAYPDATQAVAAALDMRGAIERFNQGQPERPVSLKIGIHHGAAIAVTLNDELDYFGQTVNIASRVQEMADAAEIWITEAVWRYPGVQALLKPYPAEPRTVEFRGIGLPMTVVRISPSEGAAQRQGTGP